TTYGNYQTTYTGGGNTAADGGGFFAGGSQAGSQAGGRGKSYEEETLRPVTIKQILDSTQSSPDSTFFQIDGSDISQLTFVGQVRNITTQTTNLTYRLDDGTAVIEVKKWIDADKPPTSEMDVDGGAAGGSTELEKPIVLDSYVRVWGRLKSFNGKKHVGAHVVRVVDDFNEVNYHMLEATYCHLYYTRGPLNSNTGGARNEDGGMFVDSYGNTAGGGGGGGAGSGGDADFAQKLSSLPPMARKVCFFLRDNNSSNEGIHLNRISQGTGLSVRDVAEAIETCIASGHAYTTVDDETWALLEY
ncbi:replication factor A protein 2, partial [Zalerion maritima]